MNNLITKCPLCSKGKLEYSQDADILFDLIDGKLVPRLDIDSVGFGDTTHLYCPNCGARDSQDDKLYIIKEQYDKLS